MSAGIKPDRLPQGPQPVPRAEAVSPAPALPGGVARHILLHPGDVACVDRADRLETLLGSCVAIVLTDPRRTVGAMCHFVHSQSGGQHRAGDNSHAEEALHTLFGLLRRRGIVPALCEAFVYGGGNMFPELVTQSPVGDSNARWALEALAQAGIRVLDQQLGGRSYRRVSWTVGPGQPVVKAVEV